MKYRLITTILIMALLSNVGAATGVNPTRQNIDNFIGNYSIGGQNNTIEFAQEIGQSASEAGLNCDVRECVFQNHTKVYINVFYQEFNNKKGYQAFYMWMGSQKIIVEGLDKGKFMYKNFGSEKSATCSIKGLKSCKIVKSYWGNKSAPKDTNTTIPVVNDTTLPVVNNTTEIIGNCTNNSTINDTVPITQENKTGPSEINVFIKNSTSNDSAALNVKLNENPSESAIGHYTEAFKNLLLGIFGGN